MAKEAKNKKYLVLEDVRVSYRPKDDSIHVLSTDVDFPSGFHLPIQKGTFVEEQLRSLLTEKGHIREDQAPPPPLLPKIAPWHESYINHEAISPGFFPIGVGADGGVPVINPYTGEEVNLIGFDVEGNQADLMKRLNMPTDATITCSPHALICGTTGGGKSVMLANIIEAALLRPDHWEVIGVDLKKVEFKNHKNRMQVVNTLDEAAEVIEACASRMMDRYEMLKRAGVNHYHDLAEPLKAVMLAIDELGFVTGVQGVKTEEGREEDNKRLRISAALTEIATYGRAAGVHLILATQRPDATIIAGDAKANIGTRILCGRADSNVQSMVLGVSGKTVNVGNERGRFYMRVYGTGKIGQGLIRLRNTLS